MSTPTLPTAPKVPIGVSTILAALVALVAAAGAVASGVAELAPGTTIAAAATAVLPTIALVVMRGQQALALLDAMNRPLPARGALGELRPSTAGAGVVVNTVAPIARSITPTRDDYADGIEIEAADAQWAGTGSATPTRAIVDLDENEAGEAR